MAKSWAVALVLVREALRSKLLVALFVFAAGLLSVFALVPRAEPETRLRVLELWFLRDATLFGAVVAIFSAGLAFPREVERKQIYLLATKPLGKMALVAGRYVGHACVLGIFVGIMFLIGAAVLAALPGAAPEARPRFAPADLTYFNTYQVQGDSNWYLGGIPQIHHDDDVEGHIQLEWTSLRREDFDSEVRARIRLAGGTEGILDYNFFVVLEVRNPEDGRVITYPKKEIFHNEWAEARFPSDMIGRDGRLWIRIRRSDPRQIVYLPGKSKSELDRELEALKMPVPSVTHTREEVLSGTSGIVLLGASRSWVWNLAKAGGLLYAEMLLVLGVALTFSLAFSGPTTVFLATAFFMVGSLTGFLEESLETALFKIQHQEADPHQHATAEVPAWLLKLPSAIDRAVLWIMPDFSSFSTTEEILDDADIEASKLGGEALNLALRLAVLFAVGLSFVFLRDFT